MHLGCHISISRGLEQMVRTAAAFGAASFQIFTKAPRILRPGRPVDRAEAERGSALRREYGLLAFAHAPYVTNLSTPEPELHALTVASIVDDLERAEAYGLPGVVVHCGKHVGAGPEAGIRAMAATLNEIFARYRGPVQIMLENTAGQGTELGTTVAELRAVFDLVPDERLALCIDTCHGHASGLIDFSHLDRFFAEMAAAGLWAKVAAVHLNDSQHPARARKDRHQKVGRGCIGAGALVSFLRRPEIQGLPVVLETPVDDEAEYRDEIAYIRGLLGA